MNSLETTDVCEQGMYNRKIKILRQRNVRMPEFF